MKKTIILLVFVVASVTFAGPEVFAPLTCSSVTTSTTPVTATSEIIASGYIKGLQIVVTPAATTCSVSVATAGSGGLAARTLYSSTEATGSAFLYPVAAASTNGTDVAEWRDVFICNDKLTVSAHTATEVTNITVTVSPVIDRK